MTDTDAIARLIEPSLEGMGYRLVRTAVTGSRGTTLQVMAERRDEAAMTVEDCALISHSVSALLDVADPIPGAYRLEVSSPGIDRPLARAEDYDRFRGCEAKIELTRPKNGRKRFRGRLGGTVGGVVRLLTAEGEEELPLAGIAKAKLLRSDELIAPAGPKSAKPKSARPRPRG